MRYLYILLLVILTGCSTHRQGQLDTDSSGLPYFGTAEIVAELPINPGNVAVSQSGQIFASVHQFRNPEVQLIKITGKTAFVPWPDASWQSSGNAQHRFNAILGVYVDNQNRLWALDNGNGSDPAVAPRLFVFDIATGNLLDRYTFPPETGSPGTFLQDLVVDPERNVVYIADVGLNYEPALVYVDMKQKTSRRFSGHPSLLPEKVDMVVENKLVADDSGKPIRIGVNPITMSADFNTIYFGAMNGKTWYALPTRVLLEKNSDAMIGKSIRKAGPKPVSDGAATDSEGNHYFTDVNNNAITWLGSGGELKTLVQRDDFVWPDNVRFGGDQWLYVSVNQLNRTPPFNGGVEGAQLPFRIYRIWTGR